MDTTAGVNGLERVQFTTSATASTVPRWFAVWHRRSGFVAVAPGFGDVRWPHLPSCPREYRVYTSLTASVIANRAGDSIDSHDQCFRLLVLLSNVDTARMRTIAESGSEPASEPHPPILRNDRPTQLTHVPQLGEIPSTPARTAKQTKSN